MIRRSLLAVSVGSLLLLLEAAGHDRIRLAAQTASAPSGVALQPAAPDSLRVVLLGSGMGPRVNLQQFGASTLVEAAGARLLFDCGCGVMIRLV